MPMPLASAIDASLSIGTRATDWHVVNYLTMGANTDG